MEYVIAFKLPSAHRYWRAVPRCEAKRETKCTRKCLACVTWKAILGAVIVVLTLHEVFKDLFHPSESGALSDWVGRSLFRLFRRRRSLLPSAGPLTVVLVMVSWALLLVTGFAFIYWAVFPADFLLRTADRPTSSEGFAWSFYYSLEMLTTLGLGDIEPNPTWLKILSGCDTLVGFSLVTASLTWILLVFPALRRTRTLARKATTLAFAEESTDVPVTSPDMHLVIAGLAEEVLRARVDLVHFPVLFYFYADDPEASLSHALFDLARFAKQGVDPGCDDLVRLTARALERAVNALAMDIARRLELSEVSPQEALVAFKDLHSPRGAAAEGR